MSACRICGCNSVILNRKGMCGWCAQKRAEEAAQQMLNKKGPFYERYQERMRLYQLRRSLCQSRESGV